MEDVLKRGYYEPPLGNDNVGWFVKEVTKLEKSKPFFFEYTKKDIIMTEEAEEDYKNGKICSFWEKILNLIMLEIIVIWLLNTEVQLIINVLLMLLKIKVILYHL